MIVDYVSRSGSRWFVDLAGNIQRRVSRWLSYQRSNQTASNLRLEEPPTLQTLGLKSFVVVPVDPEPWFVKMVEEGLRKLPDFIRLGQLPLAEYLGLQGDSHIARGKELHQYLLAGIESLRPAGIRPVNALSRDWFSYVVLYDAYVLGVRNNEVMARLYISEGTFNRTRRHAIRGLAKWLLEGMGHMEV